MIGNGDIAAALEAIAELLELERENPWRVRAYRRAARTIDRHGKALAQMVADGEKLTALPGIGADLAKIILELVETGRAQLLEELSEGTPPGVRELARVKGIGLRRARKLHDELGIRSLGDLEQAVADGRLAASSGFGEKTAAKVQEAIAAERARRSGRMKLTEARRVVPPLVDFLAAEPSAEEIEAVGAYRRQAEQIDRIELLVASENPDAVLARFSSHAGLDDVEVDGQVGHARLRRALPVELRVVPPARWGTALVESTGSRAHASAILALAPGARRREADVYVAAGLPWIAPELREDGSEIAAARDGRLPELVESGDIKGDLQMHSTWSDGSASIARMAAACRARGYEYLAITDHSGSLVIARGLSPERLEAQWREIEEIRAAHPGIVLLRSMEVDILPDGTLDLPDGHLAELDCVLAAVHVQQRLPRREMTRRILRAIEHPSVDILGHPTGKRGLRPSYEVDLDEVLRACAALDVAVELDCSPDRSDLSADNARRALDLGCTLVVDTDAHAPGELDYMDYGVGQARRAWAEPARVLNCRGWPDFRRWLQRRGRRAGLQPALNPGRG